MIPLRLPAPMLERVKDAAARQGISMNALLTLVVGQWLDPPQPAAVSKSSKLARNAPCPCGSGEKFKRCCGDRL